MNSGFSILVVDDDRLSRITTAKQLESEGYDTMAVESPRQALEELENKHWNVVLSDVRMPEMNGIELLREVKRRAPEVEVILMTAYGTVETAVQAMKEGAADFLTKPFQLPELEMRLRRIAELQTARVELDRLRRLVGPHKEDMGIVGRCPQLYEVRDRIRQFADHAAPVLITGETGTGKEIVARALHERSQRSRCSFVPVSCGSIPTELAESELFGHEQGAFTGAQRKHKGCFGRADGGTLLLDDVDDLPLDTQVKLLRVLQEGTFTSVGGSKETEVIVRVVATTKTDLSYEVEQKRFRSDLFYRLRGLEIQLPPLRERGDDVLLLSSHFLKMITPEGRDEMTLDPEAAAFLRRYTWPGNVRELHRALESSVVLCSGTVIQPEHLPAFLLAADEQRTPFALNLAGCSSVPYEELVHKFEQSLMQWAMRESGGKQTVAARLLGIPRTTLQSKLVAHNEDTASTDQRPS